MEEPVDIREDDILISFPEELEILLKDRTTQNHIFWATDSYSSLGKGFRFKDEITVQSITGSEHGRVIRPRSVKSREEQDKRVKSMAEVFTPSWVCNTQNNLVDNAWFGKEGVFNEEFIDENGNHRWNTNKEKIVFPSRSGKRAWRAYVRDIRLEITCGEGPYIVSRYDTVSGEFIPLEQRIGFLDRKLRIVGENTRTRKDWLAMAKEAIKASYGYDWQGDNVLLARESVFVSFIEYYQTKFNEVPSEKDLLEVAEIISWNFWQMDGLTFGLPGYTVKEQVMPADTLFSSDFFNEDLKPQERYCIIMDWLENKTITFSSLIPDTKRP